MDSFPKHIFKQYDIRGLVDSEITEDLAFAIGKAYATFLSKEIRGRLDIVVGRDMRESSLKYQKALMKALTREKVKVLDIGLVSTPAFYFAVGHLKAGGGIMVSASHNPATYNGFKLTRALAVPISGETGIQEISEIVRKILEEKSEKLKTRKPGNSLIKKIKGIPALSAQAEFGYAGKHPIKKMKIVADAANGMGVQYLEELFGLIDTDITRMFWDFDGTFPNHEADPFERENTQALRDKVKEIGADLGIATDGDGDRIFFVDDRGELVEPAILRGLLAQIVLRDNPGAAICYDIRPGKITSDMILDSGGKPCVTRVGHSLIKEKMREVGAMFGGESSGHFFYAFPSGVYEGPVTVATQILQEITRRGCKFSEIIEPLEKYAHSGEINFVVEDKQAALDAIKEKYNDAELSELDGVTITYPDFWFNVRASNTESKLRLNLEAVDRQTMERKLEEVIGLIKMHQNII